MKGRLGFGNQRACSSDEKHALLHDTIDNLGFDKRNRIKNNELLSDSEILDLPKTLGNIDSLIATQLEWRSRPDYATHLLALQQKELRNREEMQRLIRQAPSPFVNAFQTRQLALADRNGEPNPPKEDGKREEGEEEQNDVETISTLL